LRATGTNQDFGEREQLLEDISGLKDTAKRIKEGKLEEKEAEKLRNQVAAEDVRAAAMGAMTEARKDELAAKASKKKTLNAAKDGKRASGPTKVVPNAAAPAPAGDEGDVAGDHEEHAHAGPPPSGPPQPFSIGGYFAEKAKRDTVKEQRAETQLDLLKKKIELDEQKFLLDKTEREARLELDRKEREARIAAEQRNQEQSMLMIQMLREMKK
jgi:hypothetical protein